MKFATVAVAGAAALATVNAQVSYPEFLARQQLESLMTPAAEDTVIKPLILGGTVVPAGQKDWLVGLRSSANGGSFCGGTLITPRHVLTAAHCQGGITHVAIGTLQRTGSVGGERIAVTRQIRHPSYSSSRNSYDFLILELATASTYAPLPLRTAAPATGVTANVAGWGTTSSGGASSSVMRQVDVPIVAQATCAARLSIDSTMICAGGLANRDSCQGDSGGPLTTGTGTATALVGVVSWGNGCGLVNYPGVYARVSVVKSWIDSTVGNTARWL